MKKIEDMIEGLLILSILPGLLLFFGFPPVGKRLDRVVFPLTWALAFASMLPAIFFFMVWDWMEKIIKRNFRKPSA